MVGLHEHILPLLPAIGSYATYSKQGDVGCIEICTSTRPGTRDRGGKILVNGQAANPELVKGQAHLWVGKHYSVDWTWILD